MKIKSQLTTIREYTVAPLRLCMLYKLFYASLYKLNHFKDYLSVLNFVILISHSSSDQ